MRKREKEKREEKKKRKKKKKMRVGVTGGLLVAVSRRGKGER